LCAATPEITEPPEGCVEVEAGIFEADGIKAAGEPTISGVEVSLLEGACSDATLLNSTISGLTGYSFEDVPPGQYCVSVNAASPTNSSLLLPGKWTAPRISTSTAQFNVTVDANENRVVHFGWDYELAP
jgi:hypothetical protein